MDKEVLSQYLQIEEEIKDIAGRKMKLEREIAGMGEGFVSEEGKGTGGVYRSRTSGGLSKTECLQKRSALEQYIRLLDRKETQLLELAAMCEEYIETIDKSEVRIMFRLRYLDGLPWWKVASLMNRMFPGRRVKFTEESCKKRSLRFFEKVT